MSNYKAPTAPIQNFKSGYIYKVEEREENEQIMRQSAKGLLTKESNVHPKVTRYFFRNDKGEPQGYIERQYVQNSKTENSEGEKESSETNSKNEKIQESPPILHQENRKIEFNSQATLRSGKKSCNFNLNPKKVYQSRERLQKYEIDECVSLDGSVYERSINNYTLDYTSSNSTPSEKDYAVKIPSTSSTFTPTGHRIERKLTKEKICSKIFSKKSPRILPKDNKPRNFCKDPNKCLKNLFTIIKPNDNTFFPTCKDNKDIDLLNKTKELLVKLIDKELQRIQSDNGATDNVQKTMDSVIDNKSLKKLKLQCMRKIEDELRLLKRLTNY